MNTIANNRALDLSLALIYIVAIILAIVIGIHLFYRLYRFVDLFMESNSNQAFRYFAQLVKSN